jgi:hypothetical protein
MTKLTGRIVKCTNVMCFDLGIDEVFSRTEATGDLGAGRNILDLEQEIQRSPKGLLVSWNELVQLARAFFQVFNAVIVGCRDVTAIPELHPEGDLYQSSEIVLEVIDSSLWRVYAMNRIIGLKKTKQSRWNATN